MEDCSHIYINDGKWARRRSWIEARRQLDGLNCHKFSPCFSIIHEAIHVWGRGTNNAEMFSAFNYWWRVKISKRFSLSSISFGLNPASCCVSLPPGVKLVLRGRRGVEKQAGGRGTYLNLICRVHQRQHSFVDTREMSAKSEMKTENRVQRFDWM